MHQQILLSPSLHQPLNNINVALCLPQVAVNCPVTARLHLSGPLSTLFGGDSVRHPALS